MVMGVTSKLTILYAFSFYRFISMPTLQPFVRFNGIMNGMRNSNVISGCAIFKILKLALPKVLQINDVVPLN
jgi:hypothetical protein